MFPLAGGLALTLCIALVHVQPSRGQRPAGDRSLTNGVAKLNRALTLGQTQLAFDPSTGYLRAALAALSIPVESQIVVFSKTSLMKDLITPQNPRALYFNDDVVVGWVRGEPFVEVAASDAQDGIVFYVLDQQPTARAVFRKDGCRTCHEGFSTLPVPRLMVKSIFPAPDGTPIRTLGEFDSTYRSPFRERWGGWYVTGRSGSSPHLGNTLVSDAAKRPALKRRDLDSLTAQFDTKNYLTPYSDIVALLVFEHQMHVLNLLTRLNLDVQFAEYAKTSKAEGLPDPEQANTVIRDGINELSDALLFVGEAPLRGPIQGTSGFAETFTALGPRDSRGRSLRQFGLKHRLMRYPCSYLIYSKMFDGLPASARDAVYRRMWRILSGEEHGSKYAYLTLGQRKAVLEILRDTKDGLPAYFQSTIR